jgi:hypothetical protein
MIAGLIGGATLLIRLAAVASVGGAVLYLAWRRGVRLAIAFAAIVLVCVAPYGIYAIANDSSVQERAAHGGSMAARYDQLLLMRQGGEPSSGQVTLAELPERIAFNAAELFALDAGPFIIPGAFRGPDESGQEALQLSREKGFRASTMGSSAAVGWVSTLITVVMLAGFVTVIRRRITVAELFVAFTIAMVLLVPARSFRYVLPLAPFLIFYFFQGVDAIARRRRSAEFGSAFRIAAACVMTLVAVEHVQYIVQLRNGPPPPWLRDYAEVTAETDWMRENLKRDGPVATSNPGLVYLTTGRRTLALTNLRTHWLDLQRAGVPYGATLTMAERPNADPDFKVVYESPRLKLWVVEIPARQPQAP